MILSEKIKWLVTVTITIVMICIFLLIGEAAVRVRQTLKYGSSDRMEDMYTYDAILDLRIPVPGFHNSKISINSQGFRGPEIETPKPANRLRIAFVGASTTFCAEVSNNAVAWPHIVTEKLKKRYPAWSFDYVNAGVPGYSVKSSLNNFNKRVAKLKPDVVVIYHATNDLSYETRMLAREAGLFGKEKVEELNWLSENSMLWYLIEKNLRLMSNEIAVSAGKGRLTFESTKLGNEFRSNLVELVKQVKDVAKTVAIATFSTQIRDGQSDDEMLKASSSALYYMPYMDPKGLLKAYKRYNEIIRQVAATEGVLLIGDENIIPGDKLHFNDTVHFKDAGSEIMADRVFKKLSADLGG